MWVASLLVILVGMNSSLDYAESSSNVGTEPIEKCQGK